MCLIQVDIFLLIVHTEVQHLSFQYLLRCSVRHEGNIGSLDAFLLWRCIVLVLR